MLQYARGIIDCPYFVGSKLLFLATALTFVNSGGGYMPPKSVYTALALYHTVMFSMLLMVPFSFAFAMETLVSVERLEVSTLFIFAGIMYLTGSSMFLLILSALHWIYTGDDISNSVLLTICKSFCPILA